MFGALIVTQFGDLHVVELRPGGK